MEFRMIWHTVARDWKKPSISQYHEKKSKKYNKADMKRQIKTRYCAHEFIAQAVCRGVTCGIPDVITSNKNELGTK